MSKKMQQHWQTFLFGVFSGSESPKEVTEKLQAHEVTSDGH